MEPCDHFFGVRFINSLGNLNYSTFLPGELNYIKYIRAGKKSKLFSPGTVLEAMFLLGNSSGVESVLRQGVIMSHIVIKMA